MYGSTEKELKYVREERSPLLRIKTGKIMSDILCGCFEHFGKRKRNFLKIKLFKNLKTTTAVLLINLQKKNLNSFWNYLKLKFLWRQRD